MARLLFLFCICFYSIFNKIKAQTAIDLTLDISPTIDGQWNETLQTDHPSEQTSATITTVGPTTSRTSTSTTATPSTSTTTTIPPTTSKANNLVKTINGLLFPLYLFQYFIGKHY